MAISFRLVCGNEKGQQVAAALNHDSVLSFVKTAG
jgi:hypothetical protein